jgi:hypothetical protein
VVRSHVALLTAVGWLWSGCSSRPAEPRPLTPDAKAYARSLQLSEVTLKATESYAQQTVTEIEGKITNSGQRTVRRAEVSCIFYDRYGQVVKRERVAVIKAVLKPGETRAFRLPFDDLPESWNNQMPQLVIAGIDFS